jgi:chromosomal replication initiation ATPase DnaA
MHKKASYFENIISMQKEIIDMKQRLDVFLNILDSFLSENSEKYSISLINILQIVCDEHGVNPLKALSDSREKQYVQCRNIYSQISVDICGYSISDTMVYINRDRSSYYNSIKNHESFMIYDTDYIDKYNSILDKIKKHQNERSNS